MYGGCPSVAGAGVGVVFVSVRLCSLVLGVLTFYFGLAGAAPLLLRVGALSLLVSFQVRKQ